jgi:predicted DsbA family dithiol-disulfide isomerase
MTAATAMTVEVWSDVICPFCYIGKRKFEDALARLPNRDQVSVVWKSFQLQPDTKTDPSRNAVQNLAEKKGWTLDVTRQAIGDVTARARAVGLVFNYEQTVVANTFDAHRLAHFAATSGKGNELQERLFKAYFIDGLNIADQAVLTALALEVGLPAGQVRDALEGDRFAMDVWRDIDQARRLGITGVPFFVFDRKYAVSGAQDSAIFLQALQKSLAEWSAAATPHAQAPLRPGLSATTCA